MATMFRPTKHFTYLIAVFLAAASVWGQQVDDSGAVFRSDTRLVDLPATVVDKSGHLITNLTKDAFKVYENGTQQQIRFFQV